jgi:hypothetical protein
VGWPNFDPICVYRFGVMGHLLLYLWYVQTWWIVARCPVFCFSSEANVFYESLVVAGVD